MGLWQLYGFARRSGGTVVVVSEVAVGTSVTMYLPRSRGAQEDVDSCKSRDNELIFVVEANREARIVAEELLEQLGYRSGGVDCAARALDVLATSRDVDLVFTDVVLPGGTDGLAVARTIEDNYRDAPIVLTTGYSKVFDADPEFPVLRKPYQIAILGRAVRKALDVRKQGGPALPL